mgnify:CR=1 FL=1
MAKRSAELAAEAVARAEREAARGARVAAITGRKSVTAYTEKGDIRNGVPVVGDEWHALSNCTRCVLVESFDEKKGAGKPI